MEQHLKFSIKEQERVNSLADLVYNSLTNKSGVKFINCGGGGGQLDQKFQTLSLMIYLKIKVGWVILNLY